MTLKHLIVVELNEINFDIVHHYANKYNNLPAFKQILSGFSPIETYGEDRYEELEPWIQWVSGHTGKTFAEHGVFRLGDIIKTPSSLTQIFESLEIEGARVGAISPMNARNCLKNPAYFIPDPWTDTPSDNSVFSRRLTEMLRQTVNDNASQRINFASLITLVAAVIRSFSFSKTHKLLGLVLAVSRKPWTRAMVLDYLIHLLHLRFWETRRANVSFVFFNAGAHIQHHYFLNAEVSQSTSKNPNWYLKTDADPIYDMLMAYNSILQDYIDLSQKNGVRLIIATGLTQIPYNRVKYYYRLKEHASFLSMLGIRFTRVLPRMTRDFEIYFENEGDIPIAVNRLKSLKMLKNNIPIFDEIEIYPLSIFVTLTYPEEIILGDAVQSGNTLIDQFSSMVVFVAIKNGMHSRKGWIFLSPNSPVSIPSNPVHIAQLFNITQECCH